MALPTFTMRQLLEAGVHFGHVTRRWNPKMEQYIFGIRQGVHILDLQQTVPMLYQAMQTVHDIVSAGGRVLFVGTKRQASQPIAEAAKKCGQYYVNHRWLGGMLTNWKTISNSIRQLHNFEEQLGNEDSEEILGLTKKELLKLTRQRDKLDRALGGIKEIGGIPDLMFVIDRNKEAIAVAEANKLGIPVIAVLDSNTDPDGIEFPIPGNDDSIRAINLYCDLISGAVLSGIQQEIVASGADIGEMEETAEENLPAEAEAPAEAPAEMPAAAPAEAAEAPEAAPAEAAAPEAAPDKEPADGEQPAAS
jgi:small subunit ribosomal protein S2